MAPLLGELVSSWEERNQKYFGRKDSEVIGPQEPFQTWRTQTFKFDGKRYGEEGTTLTFSKQS